MTLKFKITCQDKNTREEYKANKEYEFDDARAKEILAVKVDGKAVAAEVKKDAKKDDKKDAKKEQESK